MKKLILVLLIVLVFLSGCTIPYFNGGSDPHITNTLSISLTSDQTYISSLDTTYMYLIFDNLNENEEYRVSAKIMNPGLFDISGSFENVKLYQQQKKTFDYRLKASQVYSETPTTVSVETTISKDFEFYLPILFANSAYLKQQEVAGKPISKGPKTYSFSDNMVNVVIELNKEPPVTTGTAYANIKVYPKGSGRLDSLHISAKGGSCEMNEFQNSASCTFSGSARTLEERKFEVSVNYDYKEIKSLRFTILPEVAEYISPIEIPGVPPPGTVDLSTEDIYPGQKGYLSVIYFSSEPKGDDRFCPKDYNSEEFACVYEEGKKDYYKIYICNIDDLNEGNPNKIEGNKPIRFCVERYKEGKVNPEKIEKIPIDNEPTFEKGDEKIIFNANPPHTYLNVKYKDMYLKHEIWYKCGDEKRSEELSVKIPPNGEKTIEGGCKIGEEAEINENCFDFSFFKTEINFVIECLKFPKGKNCPALYISDYPEEYENGEHYTIDLIVRNEGDEDVEDVKIIYEYWYDINGNGEFKKEDDDFNIAGRETKKIKELPAGAKTTVSFDFNPKENHQEYMPGHSYALWIRTELKDKSETANKCKTVAEPWPIIIPCKE